MLGRNNERQMVGVDHVGHQPVVIGIVADYAKFEIAIHQLRRNLAREAPPNLNLDLGV